MSSIASLFGPTAEEIVYDRNQQERLRQQAQLQQSLAGQETQAARDFYQSGYNIAMGVGKGLAGAFGYSDQMQDPRIAKSIAMRKVFSDLSAEDLNDPSKIAMISQLADEYDLPELKLWTADRERKLLEEESTRQKRINDANKVTTKGHGLYSVEGIEEPQQGYIVEQAGQPPTIYLSNTNQPAPPDTKKYIAPPSSETGQITKTAKFDVGKVKQSFEAEFNRRDLDVDELSKNDRLNLYQDAAGDVAELMKRENLSETEARKRVVEDYVANRVRDRNLAFSPGFNDLEYVRPSNTTETTKQEVKPKTEQQTSLDNLPDEISNIQFDETAGERPAFLEDGTVVIMNADGTIKKTTPIKLSKEEMKELGIKE